MINLFSRAILTAALLFLNISIFAQNYSLYGNISNQKGEPQINVLISIEDSNKYDFSDVNGDYEITSLPNGTYIVSIEFTNGQSVNETVQINGRDVEFNFKTNGAVSLEIVEIFGDRNREQRKIEQITRFPVSIKDQIQSISIISEKLIEDQGALTVTDAARNVPGVNQFASYGGIRESMSIRGYRGTPVLKNGVRTDSDFRTAAVVSDMAGVESIQIIKGSAALTQGIGDGLGSAGGVINVVTKTPRFTDEGEISLRTGSWWRSRLQYDGQKVFGENKNLGFRMAGAFQAGNSYKNEVKNSRVYVTPSFAWKPDNKTEVVLAMDYLHDKSTPDRGTVNLAPDTEEALYDIGSNFTGFTDDKQKTINVTYSGEVTRKLTDKMSVRVGYYSSFYESDMTAATLGAFKDADGNPVYNKKNRGLGRSFRDDRNSTIQVDLMGKNMEFGIFKWSWQLGYDYTSIRTDTRTAEGIKVLDVIDVFEKIDNSSPVFLPDYDATKMELGESLLTKNHYYGFVTQHHLGITDYVKLVGGLRWSYSIAMSESATDPFLGVIFSPVKNINLFGSFTTNSSLRTAHNPLADGGIVGASKTDQYEFGVKSNWFHDRLRANIVYYDMNNKNLSYELYDEDQNPTGLYGLAGNLRRKGVEIEVAGRPWNDLQIMAGYAYLDAFYENSPAYMDGSRPMNAAKHTANAWIQYKFSKDALKGLSLGAGVYYVGERPVNEYTKITAVHNTVPGVKYFDMPAYTTLNAQVGYEINKFNLKLFFNNLTNSIGYNSYYRGGFINQTDPFNISAQVNYKF